MNGAARRGAVAAAAILTATGCTVGPDFTTPRTSSPAHYGAEPTDVPGRTSEDAADEAWWTRFGDPELSSLAARLAQQNLDVQAAAERIAQARAQRTIAAAQGLPRIQGQARYLHERESENGLTSLVQPAPGAPLEFDLADPQAQASWELDLFGRVRRVVEAANADAQAAVEARRAVALSALADLAQTYLQLRGVQAREAVTLANGAAAKERRRLVRDRYANGVATLSDVAQADAQASTIDEDLPTLRASQARLVNALGLLLGEAPRALEPELAAVQPQPTTLPTVPTGLPADLLRRRPDIREAEARLHAATATTGVAVADFYPNVTLNGAFGTEALGTNHLFDASSRMFMVGPTVTLPIFQGGRLRGQLRLRQAQEREAALAYRSTVLQAWRDVDDALTAYAQVQHRRAAAEGALRDNRTALQVAEQRHAQGVETFIDVTLAQAAVFRAQDGLAQAQTDVDLALVALFRALGGGWASVESAGG